MCEGCGGVEGRGGGWSAQGGSGGGAKVAAVPAVSEVGWAVGRRDRCSVHGPGLCGGSDWFAGALNRSGVLFRAPLWERERGQLRKLVFYTFPIPRPVPDVFFTFLLVNA